MTNREGKKRGEAGGRVRRGKSIFGEPRGTTPLVKVVQRVIGVGYARARGVCQRLGILEKTPWGRLTAVQRGSVEAVVSSLPDTGEGLRQAHRARRRGYLESQSIRGIRRRRGLPVRGQRTKTNARTARRLNAKRLQRFV